MKSTERHLAVMAGDWPNPIGFVDIGTIADAGLTPAEQVLAYEQPVVDKVRTLQARHTVSLTFALEQINHAALEILFGPLALLAWQFRRINPHWYLEGTGQ